MTPVKPIRVLANARELIDVLAAHGPLSPADIATSIAVPRPSVYRLISGLEAISLVHTLHDGRVQLSRRWLHLAEASIAGMTEWRTAPATLERVVEETGQTAYLSVPRDGQAVCISWVQGRGIGVLVLRPGRSLPYHAGAAGRALLAFGPEEDAEAVLARAPFPALTPHTLIEEGALREDIARTRERGYSFSDQDVTLGISALGVPVPDHAGTTRGSLSIGGLSDDIHAETDRYVDVLQRAAGELFVETTEIA